MLMTEAVALNFELFILLIIDFSVVVGVKRA